MHKYMFHIGDYHSHTSHLSPMEDLAYRRILDRYYLQEAPLKGTSSTVARALGLTSSVDEVTYVLGAYFAQDDEGFWRQDRVEDEILAYQSHKKASTRGGKASGKARKQAASEPPLNTPSTTLEPPLKQPLTVNRKPLTNTINTRPRFTRPSVDEVREYCSQRNNSIDAEAFVAHYETNGWVQGKGKPIKNWKMAVVTWEKSRQNDVKKGGSRARTITDDLTDRSWAN